MSVYSSQIIKTLSEQVQHLLPLRQSYHQLQAYHAKVIQDMQEAIAFGVSITLFRICHKLMLFKN